MTAERSAQGTPLSGATASPAYVFAEGVVRQAVGGEMVLLDTRRQLYFGLDAVGADVVVRLTTTSWDEALAALVHAYDVDRVRLEKDARALVAELLSAGLLRDEHDG